MRNIFFPQCIESNNTVKRCVGPTLITKIKKKMCPIADGRRRRRNRTLRSPPPVMLSARYRTVYLSARFSFSRPLYYYNILIQSATSVRRKSHDRLKIPLKFPVGRRRHAFVFQRDKKIPINFYWRTVLCALRTSGLSSNDIINSILIFTDGRSRTCNAS